MLACMGACFGFCVGVLHVYGCSSDMFQYFIILLLNLLLVCLVIFAEVYTGNFPTNIFHSWAYFKIFFFLWCPQPEALHFRLIGNLKKLVWLNGESVGENEVNIALRQSAGSCLSQLLVLGNSRADTSLPRSLVLGSGAHIIMQVSRLKPEKVSEADNSWYSLVSPPLVHLIFVSAQRSDLGNYDCTQERHKLWKDLTSVKEGQRVEIF